MSKLMVMVSSRKMIDKIDTSILIGIDNLSVNMPCYFSFDEVKEIVNSYPNEVFISLNKNMHNGDLELLKETLIELNDLNIKGVFFYDLAILNLKEKLNLKYDLVWAQEHMGTNYATAKYYKNLGVKYTLLAGEITKNEILEINEKNDLELIVPIFGYISMFTSKRHAVKNYFKTFNIKNNDELFYIKKEGLEYPVVDNKNGTFAYSAYILNGIKEYLELTSVSYALLNGFNIDEDSFIKVIDMFNGVNKDNVLVYDEEINNMFNTNTGFLNEETIYKVKKNG